MIVIILRLKIRLDEPLYFATRELGRSYQSGEYLHNYALSYALGLVFGDYHDPVQVPHYREHLSQLNQAGVYVTPARPVRVGFAAHTFKFADTRYHVKMEQSSVNIPTYGKARELSEGSEFVAYLLSQGEMRLPKWIRLGKWLSKAEVCYEQVAAEEASQPYICQHPLNPLDLPYPPGMFDVINMPPVSLIENAHLNGTHWCLSDGTFLPKGLEYRFA